MINIEETEHSPRVYFDSDHNTFELIGVSRPEDVVAFYEPVRSEIEAYTNDILAKIDKIDRDSFNFMLMFDLYYINSASSKYILQIIDSFRKLHHHSLNISIVWKYEDNDDQILEDGEDLSEVIGIPFEFIPRKQ